MNIDNLRRLFESHNHDSYGFARSIRGTYRNPVIARDWKWFQLGHAAGFPPKIDAVPKIDPNSQEGIRLRIRSAVALARSHRASARFWAPTSTHISQAHRAESLSKMGTARWLKSFLDGKWPAGTRPNL